MTRLGLAIMSAVGLMLVANVGIAAAASGDGRALRTKAAKTMLAPHHTGVVTARCPDRLIPVSGGFRAGELFNKPRNVALGSKRHGNGWRAWGHNFDSAPRSLNAYVYCGRPHHWDP